jgi:hypothetical protein
MNHSHAQAGGTAPAVEARLQSQAREAAGVVADIGPRLERLLDRLRVPPPRAIDGNTERATGSGTLDGSLADIRNAAGYAHELLNEIEGLV